MQYGKSHKKPGMMTFPHQAIGKPITVEPRPTLSPGGMGWSGVGWGWFQTASATGCLSFNYGFLCVEESVVTRAAPKKKLGQFPLARTRTPSPPTQPPYFHPPSSPTPTPPQPFFSIAIKQAGNRTSKEHQASAPRDH